MFHLTDLFGFLWAGFPPLVLLCVSGVTATIIVLVIMRSTHLSQKDPWSDAEEESQEVEVSSERAELEDRVRELEELLCEAHRECERKTKECEQQREIYHTTPQYDQMALTQNNEFLKASLAEAEEKYEQGIKTMAKLEKENSELRSKVNILEDSMQELGMLLSETHTESAELSMLYENEVSLRKYMQCEYDNCEEKLHKDIVSLKVSLAEAERQYERSMESNAQLESEISDLRSEVNRLQGSVELLGAELSDTHTRCNELTSECGRRECKMSILQYECSEMKEILLKDCEREPEVHRMLLAQNAKLKQKEELLMDSLAEAERKYDQAMSSKAQLEYEKSELMSLVNTLQASVQKMEEELSETHNKCEVMKEERELYSIQKLHCEEMSESLEQCKELLKEFVQERESHRVLTSQCNLALTQNEESLMLSLAEVKKQYEQAEMTNAQLENDKSDLLSKVNKLRETVEGLSSLLSETHKKYDEATKDGASARGILEFVQSEANKQARVLTQEKKSLEVALADAKNRYEDAMKSNSVLAIELSNLASDLNRLEARVTETEAELSESRRRCVEVMAECEQKTQEMMKLNFRLSFCTETTQTLINDYQTECQAHEALKVQYDEMKEHHDELQKECEQEQKAYEILKVQYDQMKQVQLNNELLSVNTLQNPVQQMQEELSETQRKCDEITSEKEQVQEAYNILKMQYQRLQEKFEKCQGILKDLCKAVESEEPLLP